MKNDWNEKVKAVLERDQRARDDDFILYLDICKTYTNVPVWAMSFEDALVNHVFHGLPSYESITRARRKMQEQHPELRGEKYQMRMERQEEYREAYRR